MAENGNRGPNDFRSRNVRKRREPPIIDASATEVPLDPTAPVAGEAADAAPLPATEPQAHDGLGQDGQSQDVQDRDAQAHEAVTAIETPVPHEDPVPHEASVTHDAADPVIFGSAMRDPVSRSDSAEAAVDDASASASASDPVAEQADEVAATPTGFAGGAPVPPYAAPVERSGGGVAPWLMALSSLVLLGSLAWVLYTEPQRSGASQIADLRTKVAALEARTDPAQIQANVAALDKRLGSADADRADLARTVSGLTTRLDDVSQQAQAARADAAKADAAKPAPAQSVPALTGVAAAATVGALTALAAKVEGVDARVAALATAQGQTARSVADLPKPVAPDFGPVNARVSTLDGDVNTLGGKINGLDGKVNGYDARLNAFDAKVNGVEGKINGFDARMNAFENRTNGIADKVNGTEAKAKAIETAANGTEAKTSAVETKTTAVEAKANDTAAALGRLQASVANIPHVDLAPLQAVTTALDGKVGKLEGQLAAAKDGTRLTEARAVGSADETRAAPIALVGQAVGRAVADGRPYVSDLDALKALGAEPDALAKLSPLAAKGAPTTAALLDRWHAVEGDVLAAVKPAEAGSALDRFAANARALVQVRRVGAVQGDDPSAIASQVGGALSSGDVPAALAAWDRLPQAGKDRSQDWAAAARGQVEAATAAQTLVGRAIATLGRTKS